MNSINVELKFTTFKNAIRAASQDLLTKEVPKRELITLNINRNQAFDIDIVISGTRDVLPLQTNYYMTIPHNIRLQQPTPVFTQRLTPLSISDVEGDDNKEHFHYIRAHILKIRKDNQNNLTNEHKLFVSYLLDEHYQYFKSLKGVFNLQPLAAAIGRSLDQVQQYYLQLCQSHYNTQYKFPIKYQLNRMAQFFCPVCNLYTCSLHFNSKNQRLFTEREAEQQQYDILADNPNYDNKYDSGYTPNKEMLRHSCKLYKQNNQKEQHIKCTNSNQCSKAGYSQQAVKLKKFQRRSIEQLSQFGFSNSCFIYKVLNHPEYPLKCRDVDMHLRSIRQDTSVVRYKKQTSQKLAKNSFKLYQPCFHEGDCGAAGCSCNLCHKWCCCKGQCSNSRKGCQCNSCGYDEKKKKNTCPCWANSLECDPEICGCKCCGNRNLQNCVQTKLVLSKSLICQGLGLFAAQDFKAQDFIIEYVGNYLIMDEESRAVEGIRYVQLVCDQVTSSHYLFEVDEYWQVDGTYFGNKSRFINHASKKCEFTNCTPAIIFSQGSWKIAIYSTKHINIGDELYFDYGDKFKTDWLHQFSTLVSKYYKK